MMGYYFGGDVTQIVIKNHIDMVNELYPGIEIGTMLMSRVSKEWVRVIEFGGEIGVQWYGMDYSLSTKSLGVAHACLNRKNFSRTWNIAGSAFTPEVPEEFNYIPPNNQERACCFWHPNISTVSLYVKEIDAKFIYCPKCKR